MCNQEIVIKHGVLVLDVIMPARQKGDLQIVLFCLMQAQTKYRTWCPIRESN